MTRAQRSALMAGIKGTGNVTTEKALVVALRAADIRGWRRHWPVPGRPDFVFPRQKIAVFVDGCFWHGCPRHYKVPASNVRFWREKVAGNRRRDRRVDRQLRKLGWRVMRIWEHGLRRKALPATIARLIRMRMKSRP